MLQRFFGPVRHPKQTDRTPHSVARFKVHVDPDNQLSLRIESPQRTPPLPRGHLAMLLLRSDLYAYQTGVLRISKQTEVFWFRMVNTRIAFRKSEEKFNVLLSHCFVDFPSLSTQT